MVYSDVVTDLASHKYLTLDRVHEEVVCEDILHPINIEGPIIDHYIYIDTYLH